MKINTSKLADILFTIAIILACTFLAKLFIDDVNKISTNQGGKSIATITFKKNTAQRQFISSLKWERLQNNSFIFNEDTTRTGTNSQAALYFEDGTKLDLADNTLVKIRTSKNSNMIDYQRGDISFVSGRNNKAVSVKTPDGNELNFTKDSVVSMIQTGDSLTVGIDEGRGVLKKDGISTTIDRSNEMIINTKSGEISLIKRFIFPITPLPDSKFLAIDKEVYPCSFSCDSEGISNDAKITLEIAKTTDFINVAYSTDTSFDGKKITAKIDVPPGIWYWRIKYQQKLFSSTRRFSVSSESSLEYIAPTKNESINYQNILPEITLSWSDSMFADAYILEISADELFTDPIIKTRTTYPEITINTLQKGEWFWRVTPVYPFIIEDQNLKVQVFKFVVNQTKIIDKPITLLPTNGSLFEFVTAKSNGIGFSWRESNEAVSYELSVSDNLDMNNILITQTTNQTWFTIKNKLINPILKEQDWYWAVRSINREGGISDWSVPKKITGVDSIVSQRLIYPPENYIVADSLVTNLRFTWRSNIPAKKIFQVSDSSDFKNIIYKENVVAETLLGKNWTAGKYFWRIRTLNANGSVFLDSDIRSFTVAPPLAPAYLTNPKPDSKVMSLDDVKSKITWEPVENADYYTVEVFVNNKPIIQLPLYMQTEIEVILSKYESATWTVKIQAEATENEKASRLLGYIAITNFEVKTLKPITLEYPKKKQVYSGLDALRKGVSIKWSSVEILTTKTLIISRDKEKERIVYKKDEPKNSELVPKLKPGVYYYDIEGETDSGFAISAREPSQFRVGAVPLLPVASGLFPGKNGIIDYDYLKARGFIQFEWNLIENATIYQFSLFRKSDNKLIDTQKISRDTKYVFKDLSKLSKGDFRWELKGIALDSNGNIEQDGNIAITQFKVDIPDISQPIQKDIKGLYGF